MSNIFQCTSDSTLRWFQYRLSHRILANVTNDYLFRINITHTFQCTFCKNDTETLLHLFVDCKHVQEIWHKLEHWGCDTCGFFSKFQQM